MLSGCNSNLRFSSALEGVSLRLRVGKLPRSGTLELLTSRSDEFPARGSTPLRGESSLCEVRLLETSRDLLFPLRRRGNCSTELSKLQRILYPSIKLINHVLNLIYFALNIINLRVDSIIFFKLSIQVSIQVSIPFQTQIYLTPYILALGKK